MNKERAYPFYTEEEIKNNADKWKKTSLNISYDHNQHRLEGHPEEHLDISRLHYVSFIDNVIPRLVAKKKGQGKVRILDIGAGSAQYADQIREKFGNNVEVTTTGLAKSKAKEYREVINKNNLNPKDLKLASVFQMSDYPEFDLIIDTFGEQYYFTEQGKVADEEVIQVGLDSKDKFNKFERYIKAIVAKLQSEGTASIYPVIINSPEADILFRKLSSDMKKDKVEIELKFDVLRINKNR